MKTFRSLFFILLLSVAAATALFFVNSHIIKSVWQDDVQEIAIITIPVFIVFSLLFFINRALFRTVKKFKKKKPSGEEGFKS